MPYLGKVYRCNRWCSLNPRHSQRLHLEVSDWYNYGSFLSSQHHMSQNIRAIHPISSTHHQLQCKMRSYVQNALKHFQSPFWYNIWQKRFWVRPSFYLIVYNGRLERNVVKGRHVRSTFLPSDFILITLFVKGDIYPPPIYWLESMPSSGRKWNQIL